MRENESSIQIGRATADDALSIASVLHESFVEYESAYTHEAFATTTPTSTQIQNRMSEGPVWVARQDGNIVGTVSAVPRSEALYMRSMAILPSARGQGIGTLLLKQVEEFAVRHKYERVFLNTTSFLTHAIRVYKQYGFQRSDEGPHDLFGTPIFTMVKNLKSRE